MLERLLSPLTRRFAWARTALAVQERASQVQAGPLAAAITLAAFLSLFPLLLVGIAVLGFVAGRRLDLADAVVRQLSLTGDAATLVRETVGTAARSKRAASAFGLAGLLWAGLGLVGTLATSFDQVWQSEGRGVKDKAYGLVWLLGATVLLGASVGATAAAGLLPGWLTWLSLLPTLVVDVALWTWTFTALTGRRGLPWRAHLPGAVAGGIGLEVLKLVGTVYVPRAVSGSSAVYGSLGVVFALLAWLAIFARLAMYAACLNVVRWERSHGTDVVEVEVPAVPGEVPAGGTRAGRALPT